MPPRKKSTITDSVITDEASEKKPRVVRRRKVVKEDDGGKALEPSPIAVLPQESPKERSYLEAVGRRKSAAARVRLWRAGKVVGVVVNQRPLDRYFPSAELQGTVLSPLKAVGQMDRLELTVIVKGGGTMAQAQAVRHGISRVLLQLNPVFRRALKKLGYLTRDPREKERKKPGLKGARRAPQWQKR